MGLFKKLFGKATEPTPTAVTYCNSNPTAGARLDKATKWFQNSGMRGRPKSPTDFIVTGNGGIPYAPITKWLPEVSRDPWTTRMGIVPIRNLGTALPSLSARLRQDHGVSDEDLRGLFNEYIGIVCIDCLAGISVDLLRTVSAYSKARGAVLSDARVARLLDGKCHSCDFDHYGIIWYGESKQ